MIIQIYKILKSEGVGPQNVSIFIKYKKIIAAKEI